MELELALREEYTLMVFHNRALSRSNRGSKGQSNEGISYFLSYLSYLKTNFKTKYWCFTIQLEATGKP
jgi:hypothetical protein